MTREEKIAKGIGFFYNGEPLYIPNDKLIGFHASEAPFTLSHGGRNSGKSHALRWDAHMRNMAIPGHRALLLRRTFPQLRNSHFGPAEIEAKKLGASPLHKNDHRIIYANGSLLQFGHCESDAAIMDYLSQEWDWIGFDELTTFRFQQFMRISASARTTKLSGRKAYVRAATNPIGEGAGWVKQFFIDKSITAEENEDYRPEEWQDFPANLDDNEYADKEAYERKLAMLGGKDSALRRAYRFGEWLVEGQFFSEWRPKNLIIDKASGEEQLIPWHVITELPTVGGKSIWDVEWIHITRAIDWGYSEMQPGWCGWFAHLPDGTAICFKEWVFSQKVPEDAARMIKEKSRGMKIRYTVGDPVMWWERSGESIAETLRKNGVWMTEADNERETGWIRLHSWLVLTHDDGLGERPKLQFLASNGADLGAPYAIRTLPSLQTDPKKPADCSQGEGVEDHAADAIRYWAMSRPMPSRETTPGLEALKVPEELKASMMAALGQTDDQGILGSESVRRG